MTDMLDLITLFAGIGIGWLMGRAITKPRRAQNAAGRPYAARGTSARCSHLWQNVGTSRTRYCTQCRTEWTEARP